MFSLRHVLAEAWKMSDLLMEERQKNSTGLTATVQRERGGWQEAEMKRVKGGEEGVRCVRGGV